MLFFDTLIRFSGVALLLILVTISFRDIRTVASGVYLILAGLTVSALLIVGAPPVLSLPTTVANILNFFAIPHLVFVWLFALSLFQNDFTISFRHWFVGLVYTLPILLFQLGQKGIFAPFPFWWVVMVDAMSVALMLHLVFATLRGRADDLQEARRRSRIYFVIVIAIIASSTALSEIIFSGAPRSYLFTAKAFTMWMGIVWCCYWLFNIDPAALVFNERQAEPRLDARDDALRKKLEQEMLENKAYLDTRLTISALATRLGVTSHRLRSLINTSLSFDNFSTYVNAYRVSAVKEVFGDRKKDHIPILTIALENGFNSLSPFNRAFKGIEGVAPSEYRKRLKQVV